MSKLEVREIGPISGETEVKIGQSGGIVRIEQDCQFILGYPVTSGGVKTQTGEYTVHTFTSSGVFEVIGDDIEVEYLVIAGGGGGGLYEHGSGGGAGGYRCSVPGEMSGGNTQAETPITLSAGSYPVIVGAGGYPGMNGFESSFGEIESIGGGAGHTTGVAAPGAPMTGGSGGGGSGRKEADKTGYSGTNGQGNKGHDGVVNSEYLSGGGGGAGIPGSGRPGGDGLESSIDGTPTYRAGGGGGSNYYLGSQGTGIAYGGLGGGGNSTAQGLADKPTSGSPSTGSGGGASDNPDVRMLDAGFGGSGIVILRYKA